MKDIIRTATGEKEVEVCLKCGAVLGSLHHRAYCVAKPSTTQRSPDDIRVKIPDGFDDWHYEYFAAGTPLNVVNAYIAVKS